LFLVFAVVVFVLAGCSAVPQKDAVKEVRICGAVDCVEAQPKHTVEQLLAEFQQLLTANDGEKAAICEADPKTRACKSEGICQFVLGGVIPGSGCAQSIAFRDTVLESQAHQINLKADMPLTFIGTKVSCVVAGGTLSVRSPDEISIELLPHFCNWMVVGNMSATFHFTVESIDLARGQIGGYWSHAISGTGNGSGTGYAVLKFPKVLEPVRVSESKP